MRRLKAYSGIILVIVCTLVFLGLNTVYGDVIGFKAFISQEHPLINSKMILTSRFIPVREGSKAIVSMPLHYFEGSVITNNSKTYLEEGLIAMQVSEERLYRVIVDVKVVYLIYALFGVIVMRSLYDKFKEKKIKGIK